MASESNDDARSDTGNTGSLTCAQLQQWALLYATSGLSVIPCFAANKRPIIQSWTPYQSSIATEDQIGRWFGRCDAERTAIAVICGKVSGNVEMIDFDRRGTDHAAWLEIVRSELPDIADTLVIEQTPSGGYHVVYRFDLGDESSEHTGVAASIGNQKLAMHVLPVDPDSLDDAGMVTVDGKQWKPRIDRATGEMTVAIAAIETRGEGGYFLCYPSPGYTLKQGLVQQPPTISREQRDRLLEIAARFDQRGCDAARHGVTPHVTPEIVRHEIPATIRMASMPITASGSKPGTDYNLRGDWRALMISHGWRQVGANSSNEYWARPGKTDGHSATWSDEKGVFYVFSSNAEPFEPDRGYSPFQLVTLIEWGGDYSACARALGQAGYGDPPRRPDEPTIPDDAAVSIRVDEIIASLDEKDRIALSDRQRAELHRPTGIIDIADLAAFTTACGGMRPPIVHGLLRSGETMNVIAAPKVRKSFLVTDLALSVAMGRPWLGMPCERRRVLVIDNELHHETAYTRLAKIMQTRGLSVADLTGWLSFDHQRGRLKSIDHYMEMLIGMCSLPDIDRYGLIIVDALYRAFPKGTDENDNTAVAALYNLLDAIAMKTGAAFALVHHTSKGIQSGKSVTDVGAGAGSQSRAADTHLVLREHEEEGVVVLDAAVRSWPPIPAMCIRWDAEHLVWVVDESTDPEALKAERKKGSPGRSRALDVADLDYILSECVTEEWQGTKQIIAQVKQTLDASDATIRRTLNDFAAQGRVEKLEGSGTKGDQFRRPSSGQQYTQEGPRP